MTTPRKALSLLLCAALILSGLPLSALLPVTASAAETAGAFTIEGGTAGEDYSYTAPTTDDDGALQTNGYLTILTGTSLTISTSGTSSDYIVINSGVAANITLNNVTIQPGTTKGEEYGHPGDSAIEVKSGAKLNLVLNGTNTLTGGNYERWGIGYVGGPYEKLDVYGGAGIHVPSGASLEIGGNGSLVATVGTDGRSASGIGATHLEASGTITINSGTVTAIGSMYNAGIGGGSNGTGGNITINGGTVTATGGYYGAGIGGGNGGTGGTITITGGTVTANGGSGGAGIGGGSSAAGDTILIKGGIVTANGGTLGGAGIGGGEYGAGGNITITGGTVTAQGGKNPYDDTRGGHGIGGGGAWSSGQESGGTFSTSKEDGTAGNAIIYATGVTGGAAIGDNDDTTGWSGIIFQGNSGTIYGNQTLTKNFEIKSGQTLTVPADSSLTVPTNTTLTVNGTLNVDSGGTLTNNGTIAGSGTLSGSGTVNGSGTNSLTNNAFATNVTVSVSPTTVTVGSNITITATVKNGLDENVTSGTVTFYKGEASNGNVINSTAASVSNGSASFTISDLGWTPSATDYTITAVYTPAEGSSQQSASSTTTLTVNAIQLSAPTGLNWNGSTASWNAVTNATGYTVQLYRDNNKADNAVTVTSGTSHDLGNDMTEAGSYTFTVTATGSGNYSDSSESSKSAALHTVSFDTGGMGNIPLQFVPNGEKATSPTGNLTKEGHCFDGWYSNNDFSEESKWAFDTSSVTTATTLYAKWTPLQYTVTLNANSGTITEGYDVKSYTYGTTTSLPTAEQITRTGYAFGGWYDNADYNGLAVTEISATATDNKEFWAKWTAINYNVTVTVEGGDGNVASATPVSTTMGTKVILTATPAAGYHFVKWEVISGGVTIGSDNSFTMPASNLEVKAVFEAHSMTQTDKMEATCTTAGKEAYYTCGNCGKHFSDENGQNEITNLDTYGLIAATGHSMTQMAKVEATCTAAGKEAYYTCGNCGKHFSDENGQNEITNLDTYGLIAATGHSMTQTAKVEATCTTVGKEAYYTCSVCKKHFSDDSGQNEIPNLDEYGIISATGHTAGTEWQHDSNTHWNECKDCGTKMNEAAHVYDNGQDATCDVCGYARDTYTLTVDLAGGNGSVTGGAYAEGAVVQIDAGTRTNYRFAGWTSSNGGSFANASSASTTFTMPAAETTITASWEYNGGSTTPIIPPTPSQPDDNGPTTDSSAGWSDIQSELEAAGDGDAITVEMNGTTEVPAEIFETIAGQDITVSFEMDNGVSWQVNGSDIPAGTSLHDLNLGVDMNTNGISANVINAITGEVSTVQITLAYDGAFGFTMTLSAPLGEEHHGYWANLYYFDERAQRLIYQTASLIDETGHAHMRMSHASQYAIVIDDYDHGAGLPFVDVRANDWYYDAVAYVFDNGIMGGMSDTTFAPQSATTRAMIVSMLHRLEGGASAGGTQVATGPKRELRSAAAEASDFIDVSAGDWYAEPVAWAASVGVVGGYDDGTFQPNKSITREELASILYRYAQYKGLDTSARADLTAYTDAPSPWAADVMAWANAEGLLGGRTATTIDAQATLTRAETAAIFQRFIG